MFIRLESDANILLSFTIFVHLNRNTAAMAKTMNVKRYICGIISCSFVQRRWDFTLEIFPIFKLYLLWSELNFDATERLTVWTVFYDSVQGEKLDTQYRHEILSWKALRKIYNQHHCFCALKRAQKFFSVFFPDKQINS